MLKVKNLSLKSESYLMHKPLKLLQWFMPNDILTLKLAEDVSMLVEIPDLMYSLVFLTKRNIPMAVVNRMANIHNSFERNESTMYK